MLRARILGTGSYAPARVVTNDDLALRIDTSDEWIKTRTGISRRHMAGPDEQTSDMAVAASKRALEAAGMKPADLDLIVVCTVTPDMPMPSCAAFVQHKLGAKCPAFDVAAACAGSLFGLAVAEQFIKTGMYRRVLVVGAEMLTRLLDWEDRATCVLFGDAAGAMILGPSEDDRRGILSVHLHTEGAQTGILTIPGGGSLHPATPEMLEKKLHKVHMNGREVYKFAVRALVEVLEEALAANKLAPGDIDHVVPHQANVRIVDAVIERLGVPRAKVILNIDEYGNTSSASVPITLDEGVRSGRIKPGDLIAMMAIGGGMAWASAIVRY